MSAINRIPKIGERLKFVSNDWKPTNKVFICRTFLITVREKDEKNDKHTLNTPNIISFIEDGAEKPNCCIAGNTKGNEFNPYMFKADAPRFQVLSNDNLKGWKCTLEGADTEEGARKIAEGWAETIRQRQKDLKYKIAPRYEILDISS